jgi:hypothetical protein
MKTAEYIAALEALPGCHYVAELHGRILFASPDLCSLLLMTADRLPKYFDLFPSDDAHNAVVARPHNIGAERQSLILHGERSVFVEHLTRCVVTDDGVQLVLGSVRSLEFEYSLEEELRIYRDVLLNRPEIGFGVHVVEPETQSTREGEISWLNAWAESHFVFPKPDGSGRPNRLVTDLVGTDKEAKRNVAISVKKKFNGEPTRIDERPREFWGLPNDGSKTPRDLPVLIRDFLVYSNPDRQGPLRPRRIITLVVPLGMPEPLVKFLQEKGARAPVLEELNIRSFEKLFQRPDPIRFRYLNRAFRQDQHMSQEKWEELLLANGLDPSNTDLDWRWDSLLERGIGDCDIYPATIANRYNTDDLNVINNRLQMEGLEPHQQHCDSDGCQIDPVNGEVQFVKMPLIENGNVIGVTGFYWPANESQAIVQRLLVVLGSEKDDILDDLPELLRVVRKNREKRVVFVNQRHAMSHSKNAREFIGKTDLEVFGGHAHDVALGYETDDAAVLNGRIIARYELHRDSQDSDVYNVLTIKSPIRSKHDYSVTGVQCVYWSVNELSKLIQETRRLPGPTGSPFETSRPSGHPEMFISYARKDSVWLEGSELVQPTIGGFRSALDALSSCSGIGYWYDRRLQEDRFDDEIAERIAQCRVFVLLLSSEYWASDYIKLDELPRIQNRRLNDATVRVIPVILKSFDFNAGYPMMKWVREFDIPNHGNGKFRDPVQQLVRDGKENEFWAHISQKIREMIESLRTQPGTADPRKGE